MARFEPVEVHETIAECRSVLDAARRNGLTVGVVPTMGALHEGHTSLIRASAADCDLTLLTIFVNPLQFGADEDLDAYPRDRDGDLEQAGNAGCDLAFCPTVEEMYPEPILTTVSVTGLSASMEGTSRPSHFAGVTTVVTKLLNIVGSSRVYFGEKDFQQLAIVRRMARDLDLPNEIVGCPTVREADGLALSSRNVYLDPEQRRAAPVLHRALSEGAEVIAAGERGGAVVKAVMSEVVGSEPLAALDYAEVVDPTTLEGRDRLSGEVRLLVAARFGSTRLLDNLGLHVPD